MLLKLFLFYLFELLLQWHKAGDFLLLLLGMKPLTLVCHKVSLVFSWLSFTGGRGLPPEAFCPPKTWFEIDRKISRTIEINITIDFASSAPPPQEKNYWKKASSLLCSQEEILL